MKNLRNKAMSLFLALALVLSMVPTVAAATVASGNLGSISWALTDDGKLTFTGSGAMPNYQTNLGSDPPWYGYKLQVTSIHISEGITSVGNFNFVTFKNLELVYLPSTLTHIGEMSFFGCDKLKMEKLPDSVKTIGSEAFTACSALNLKELPPFITSIGHSAFASCSNLELTSLPNTLKTIQDFTFSGCGKLALTELPSGLISIGMYGFNNCTKMRLSQLPNASVSVGDSAFSGVYWPYQIERYLQSQTGSSDYTLKDETIYYGRAGSKVTINEAAITGYIVNTEKSTASVTVPQYISYGGALRAKVYYDYTTWQVTFNSNEGSVVPPQSNVQWGTAISEPAAPVRAGYDFAGWHNGSTLFDFSTLITKDITLTAKWTARNDTPYRVEHYRQDVTGSGYTFEAAEELTGTTAANVTAQAKTYIGFNQATDHPGRVSSGTIAPDGSLVLKLYYDRALHNVAFDTKGGSSVAAQGGIRFEGMATEPAAPSKTGYNFGGWWADEDCTITYNFSAPITSNVIVYASWLARGDTPYRIEHYRQNVTGGGYTLADTDELTGTTAAAVTAAAKIYTGYAQNLSHPSRVGSGAVAPDGSLTLRLYYDRNLHSVTFNTRGGSNVPVQTGIRFEGTAIEPLPPSKQGYDFGGWWADEDCTIAFDFSSPITANVTIYASWIPRSDTKYRVEHYQQNMSGAGYTLQSADNLTDTTDATVTAQAKTFTGFHELETHADRVATGSVAPDGSLVLKLYYDRDLHSVTFDTRGGSSVPAQTGIRFEGTATEPVPPSKQGYDFGDWWADEECTITFDFLAPTTENVTAYASWTPRSDTVYRVEHYQQDVSGSGYSLEDTDELTGTTETTVTAQAKPYTGFTLAADHPGRVISGTVAPDGSLVLKLYYDRNLHIVTFSTGGGSIVAAQSGIRFGGVSTAPEAPSKTGYSFGGWWADEDCTVIFDFATPITTDVTAYASWAPRSDTTYRVEHFQQDVSGSGYSLEDTEELSSTTNTMVTAMAKTYIGFALAIEHPGRVSSGTVAPDGSLVLKLYYDRKAIKVNLNPNGGKGPTPSSIDVKFGYAYGNLPMPVRDNYTFIGWYTRADGGIKILASDLMNHDEDITLYAQWANDQIGVVDGDVQDQNGNPLANVKVTIRAGAVNYKSTATDSQGRFTITDVRYGTYNLVAEKESKIVTSLFEIKSKLETQTVILPIGITNSIIVVEANTPQVVAGGLDSLFGQEEVYSVPDAAIVESGGKVELRLTIAARTAETAGYDGRELQKAAIKPIDMLLEMNITKEVFSLGAEDPISSDTLTELPNLMTFIIPLTEAQKGRTGHVIYRAHGGAVDEITAEPNAAGEFFLIQDGQLVLYARKFSLYALAFDVPAPTGSSSYYITATAGQGGTITPTGKTGVLAGESKVFTISPNAGHKIADVLVDGKSFGAVTSYQFNRVFEHHTIEVLFYCPSVEYNDLIPEAWYHQSVDIAISQGYMIGIGQGGWAPEQAMTRAEFVAVLARFQGSTLPAIAPDYEDVAAAAWYAPSVTWAQEASVGVGYGKRRFGPDDVLTREQMLLMLYRYAGSVSPGSSGVLAAFQDGGRISTWATEAMVWAVNADLIQGEEKDFLNPGSEITRAEVAAILMRYLGALEE